MVDEKDWRNHLGDGLTVDLKEKTGSDLRPGVGQNFVEISCHAARIPAPFRISKILTLTNSATSSYVTSV